MSMQGRSNPAWVQSVQLRLPDCSRFPLQDAYTHTALHELGHATGLPSWLNRPTLVNHESFGSETYAWEEHERSDGERGAGNSASDGHVVESLYVPLIRPGGVAPHKGGFFHEPPFLAARHVDHHRDPGHDAPARHVPR